MESLARKYRPKTFEECCGQEAIIKILKRQLSTDQIKNVYLFCGPSGCGKTTCARIFANEINKGEGNPIEIDAASNNGVDNVRDIIRDASQRAIDAKYKIYIIDECHALTNAAWQSFLKCLEEPPIYTIFILCTTDPQKIPPTIMNRCMRFNFNRINSNKINNRLNYICEQERYINYIDACDFISRISHGQLRDAIASLEKCADYNTDLILPNVLEALGNVSYGIFFKLTNALIDGKQDEVLSIINHIDEQGMDIKLFVDQFLSFALDVLKYSLLHDISVTKFPNNLEQDVITLCKIEQASKYYDYIVDKLLGLKNMLKTDTEPKSTTEVMMINICRCV